VSSKASKFRGPQLDLERQGDEAPRVYVPSPAEVAAKSTNNMGFTRAQLAEWGVPWPPPKGWRRRLENKYRRIHGAPVRHYRLEGRVSYEDLDDAWRQAIEHDTDSTVAGGRGEAA
jgi:hypothetical protein